jgi:hypothetical protein
MPNYPLIEITFVAHSGLASSTVATSRHGR